MKRLISAKPLLAAVIGVAAVVAGTAAHARTDVQVSVALPFGGYVQPAPVYVQPAPVYVQPRTMYVQPAPVYYQPAPVYYQESHRHHGRHGAWGDADRDGVPNRYDRAPNNPYRR